MSGNLQLIAGWAHTDACWEPLRAALARLHFDAGKVPIIGSWSLGSFQSLETAAAGPEVPRALVLISSTARFCATAGYEAGLPEAALRALQRQFARDPREALAGFHRLCAAPHELAAGELSDRVEASMTLPTETLAAGLRALRDEDLRGRLEHIACPVLLLHGGADQVVPAAASRFLAEKLRHAKRIELPDAGHDLPLRHAGWIAEHIAAFVNGLA